MANCVGPSDNFVSVGQSAIWNNRGDLLAQMDGEARCQAFARQVYDEVIRNLPPDKRQDFDHLYGQGFFGTINVGAIK